MNRGQIAEAAALLQELERLEGELEKISGITHLSLQTSSFVLALQNYPQPSALGDCFRTVREAWKQQIRAEMQTVKDKLVGVGVKL
jgi:hypothetical protein